jgi:hypothetical protein
MYRINELVGLKSQVVLKISNIGEKKHAFGVVGKQLSHVSDLLK